MKKMNTRLFAFLLITAFAFSNSVSAAEKRDYYEIKFYHLTTNEQVKKVDDFLKDAYLPALHRAGIAKVGVFHPRGIDTAVDKRVYVFIPVKTLEKVSVVEDLMITDPELIKAGDAYWNAEFNEGPTERLYRQKVKMFNEGGEISLFKRLNFNAVFYSEVVAGSHQPNLMYMTSFNNIADRDEHWKVFGSDPEWTKLKVMPEYLNSVSKNEQILLNPTEFSEL